MKFAVRLARNGFGYVDVATEGTDIVQKFAVISAASGANAYQGANISNQMKVEPIIAIGNKPTEIGSRMGATKAPGP